jgi:hypothetical protein
MNEGSIKAGCEAFRGWYVRSDGQVRKGLIARRSGIGDGRKSERDLCLEGLTEPKADWYFTRAVTVSVPVAVDKTPAASAATDTTPPAPPVKVKKQSFWPWMRS